MNDEEGNSSLWVRTSHESCDRPAFRWIKSWKRLESDIPGTTLSRKSRRGRSRERRRTSFVRESWRITRNREPFHSCFFFFFPLSLSPSSDSLCHPSSPLRARFESRPSSKRNKLNLAGFQRSWRNSSNRPTRFSSRVRIF